MNIRWIRNRHRDGRSLSDDPSPKESEENQSLACLFRLVTEHLLQQSVGQQPVLFVTLLSSAFFPTAQHQEFTQGKKLFRYHNFSAKVVFQLSRLLSNLLSTFNKFISSYSASGMSCSQKCMHIYLHVHMYIYSPVATEITYVEIFQLQKRIPFHYLKHMGGKKTSFF